MRFRRKPEVVEAVQWTGHNFKEVEALVGLAWKDRVGFGSYLTVAFDSKGPRKIAVGRWLVKDERGKFSVVSAKEFETQFEQAEEKT